MDVLKNAGRYRLETVRFIMESLHYHINVILRFTVFDETLSVLSLLGISAQRVYVPNI